MAPEQGDSLGVTGKFQGESTIIKVNPRLGLIFGFAGICTVDGSPFYDADNEHWPDESMLVDSTEFAKNCRVACDMHSRDGDDEPVPSGAVVHTFPLTREIAESLEITTKYTGLLIAMAPDDPEIIAKAERGEYRGFSLGGDVLESEYEED